MRLKFFFISEYYLSNKKFFFRYALLLDVSLLLYPAFRVSNLWIMNKVFENVEDLLGSRVLVDFTRKLL